MRRYRFYLCDAKGKITNVWTVHTARAITELYRDVLAELRKYRPTDPQDLSWEKVS